MVSAHNKFYNNYSEIIIISIIVEMGFDLLLVLILVHIIIVRVSFWGL